MHRLATDKISMGKRTLEGGEDHQLGRKRPALARFAIQQQVVIHQQKHSIHEAMVELEVWF